MGSGGGGYKCRDVVDYRNVVMEIVEVMLAEIMRMVMMIIYDDSSKIVFSDYDDGDQKKKKKTTKNVRVLTFLRQQLDEIWMLNDYFQILL